MQLLKHVQVDVAEYMFKLALLQRKYDQVIGMIKGSGLCGSAIIRWVVATQWRSNGHLPLGSRRGSL
jgi:hypothetical protein